MRNGDMGPAVLKKQKTLRENARAIRSLSLASKTIRKSMVSNASKEFISSLVDAVKRILKGNVSLSRTQLRQLQPYERLLERFTASKTGLKSRRTILQDGGFLGALLPTIIGVLPDIINSFSNKRRRESMRK